jgi:uncharacterized membrane-anchored protein
MAQPTERLDDLVPQRSRVPKVTVDYWVVQVLAVTLGETVADYLKVNLELGLATSVRTVICLLALALIIQFKQRRYVPVAYWASAILMSIAGTLFADALIDGWGIDPRSATVYFAVASFALWFAVERSISIVEIKSSRSEIFYWLTLVLTFALGAAANVFIAETYTLGCLGLALFWVTIVGAVTTVSRVFGCNIAKCFWIAFILISPMGSALGDLLSQPLNRGGLGFGTMVPSLIFLAIIAAFIPYMTLTREDGKIRTIRFDFQ